MRRTFENLEDLSPFILKARIDRIKNKIAKLERQRAAAREADQQWKVKRESERAEARKRLVDLKPRLEKVRQEIEKIKNDPSNFQTRRSVWGILAGQPNKLELSTEAKRRLSDLETQEAGLLDEEYSFEVEAGIERHPEVIHVMGSLQMPSGFLFNAVRDPEMFNVGPWKVSDKYIRYRRRREHGGVKRYPEGPFNPPHWEADLDKRIQPLESELSRLDEALGPQQQKLAELESWRARGMNETRELARRLRMSFAPTDVCPYCGKPVGREPHLDHIYPVSKGGLSVRSNLVFVCLECNQKKSDMTLTAFINVNKLDRDAIEARLNQLGKEF